MKKLNLFIVCMALLPCMLFFPRVEAADYYILVEDIEIEPGVTIDINVNVYVNEAAQDWGDLPVARTAGAMPLGISCRRCRQLVAICNVYA